MKVVMVYSEVPFLYLSGWTDENNADIARQLVSGQSTFELGTPKYKAQMPDTSLGRPSHH